MGLTPKRYRLDPVLKELSFGVWEGLTWSEIEVKDPKGLRARRKDRWGFAPEGGESYAMLADRLRPWLGGLNEHAFVISHGGVARSPYGANRGRFRRRRRSARQSFRGGRLYLRTGVAGGSGEDCGGRL